MASQQIKNELNNELETLLLEAKFEVRKEGKRRLEELKEQIPTPPEIIAILKAELSENACSIAGIEKFMAKAQDLNDKLSDIEKIANIASTKLEGIKEKLAPILDQSGPIGKVQSIVDGIQPIVNILQRLIPLAIIALTANSGPTSSGAVTDQLSVKKEFAKAKIKSYASLFSSIPSMLNSYIGRAQAIYTPLDALLFKINFVKSEIAKLKMMIQLLMVQFELDCSNFNATINNNFPDSEGEEESTPVIPNDLIGPNGLPTNVANLNQQQVLDIASNYFGDVINYLQQQGEFQAVERIYSLGANFSEDYNISFKNINPQNYNYPS